MLKLFVGNWRRTNYSAEFAIEHVPGAWVNGETNCGQTNLEFNYLRVPVLGTLSDIDLTRNIIPGLQKNL